MGFFDNLFGNNNPNKEPIINQRLIHLVKKKADLEVGVFGNIQNDLAEYISIVGQNEDKLRMMAYGYARRSSAAGLYLQGIFGEKEYAHTSDMFKKLQLITGHTKEFQIEATNQSNELIASYDQRLTPELISTITSMVELKQVVCAYDQGREFSVDEVLMMITRKDNKVSGVQSEIKQMIDDVGIDDVVHVFSELTNQKINSKKVALQFVLEELDASSQGNDIARSFAQQSGFTVNEYRNAMLNSFEEVDGADGPQVFLHILMELNDMDLMIEIRLRIIDNIMQIWKLGKYAESGNIKINNENIIAAAHAIADDCFSEGVSNPRWMKIYNAALDNMYSNALYLGYGVSDGINVNINNPEEANVKKSLNMLISMKAPKENIEKALVRLLTDKKFNSMEKQVLLA